MVVVGGSSPLSLQRPRGSSGPSPESQDSEGVEETQNHREDKFLCYLEM